MSIHFKLIICCIKFKVHYLHRTVKLTPVDQAPFLEILYSFKPYYYYYYYSSLVTGFFFLVVLLNQQ
jgi:hypothetical protein